VPATQKGIHTRNRGYRMMTGALFGKLWDYLGYRAANAVEYREYPGRVAG
jgi:hypothetical protein